MLKDGKYEDLPVWLQKLWDIDSSLARQAENYIDGLTECAKNTEQANQPDSQYNLGGLILPNSMWAEPK